MSRRQHTRCKKKKLTTSELKQKAARSHLSTLGVTWPAFQKLHARQGFDGFGMV